VRPEFKGFSRNPVLDLQQRSRALICFMSVRGGFLCALLVRRGRVLLADQHQIRKMP
jgi:hypothetical protein